MPEDPLTDETTGPMSLPPGLLIDTIRNSTKESVALSGRMDTLERAFRGFEETLEERMGRLEGQMTASNAHLDNIAREAARTNHLLEKSLGEQEARTVAVEERRKENRNLVVRSLSELWAAFKPPLAMLFTGAVAWLVYTYFFVPS